VNARQKKKDEKRLENFNAMKRFIHEMRGQGISKDIWGFRADRIMRGKY